ncbi:MAG TPA: PIN domain-containing protein [Micropepsaceae bacterium]|nr:PIN domain-containing protein [Micropepsaceae bacterium]
MGSDVDRIDLALQNGELILPPAVLAELLSDPASGVGFREVIVRFEVLETLPGYWARAGQSRRQLRSRGCRAKLGDALIAQSCIDHDVHLITRDPDFRQFTKHCGLQLFA